MSPVALFIIGFVIFLPVFVVALSFVYSTGVRIDREEEAHILETSAADAFPHR